jgi:hypothetical protein
MNLQLKQLTEDRPLINKIYSGQTFNYQSLQRTDLQSTTTADRPSINKIQRTDLQLTKSTEDRPSINKVYRGRSFNQQSLRFIIGNDYKETINPEN